MESKRDRYIALLLVVALVASAGCTRAMDVSATSNPSILNLFREDITDWNRIESEWSTAVTAVNAKHNAIVATQNQVLSDERAIVDRLLGTASAQSQQDLERLRPFLDHYMLRLNILESLFSAFERNDTDQLEALCVEYAGAISYQTSEETLSGLDENPEVLRDFASEMSTDGELAVALALLSKSAAGSGTTAAPQPTSGMLATVVEVTDGDTIDVRLADGSVEPVRLIGINAPEQGECLANEATGFLSSLIEGEEIVLATQVNDRDQYDRLLRDVYLGDLFVNEELVRQGYAMARRYEPDTHMAATLEGTQLEAQRSQRGIWDPSACGPGSTTVMISSVHYDADGDDNLNLNGEWATIRNNATTPVDLSGWVLKDESSSHRFTFPTGFVLIGGEEATVYTGCGDDFGTDLYWCNSGSAVWNNDGDTAFLLTPTGSMADFWQYGTSATTSTTRAITTTTFLSPFPSTTEGNCHPSYEGRCVPVGVSDVDCAGGSGDGPYYTGRVKVVGPDVYGLDRDGDGIGCESS